MLKQKNLGFFYLFHKKQTVECFHVTENDIFQITKPLDTNKMHEWNNISIKVVQISGKSTTLLFH